MNRVMQGFDLKFYLNKNTCYVWLHIEKCWRIIKKSITAKEVAAILNENLIKLTGEVIKDTKHMQSEARKLSWFQYFSVLLKSVWWIGKEFENWFKNLRNLPKSIESNRRSKNQQKNMFLALPCAFLSASLEFLKIFSPFYFMFLSEH